MLARAFQELALESVAPALETAAALKVMLERELVRRFDGKVDRKYLKVTRLGSTHQILYAYLVQRLGKPVPAAELRILTQDAVHTERRVRELRDLGLNLEAVRTGGSDAYILRSGEPDVDLGCSTLVRLNIQEDRSLDPAAKDELLRLVSDIRR